MKYHKLIVSGLGVGYMPIAPGTAGSVLGILLFYFLNLSFQSSNVKPSVTFALNLFTIILFLLLGVFSIKKVHKIWSHDDKKIVIDEIVGVWIAVLAVPFNWINYLLALVLFRFFDIGKPFLIKKIDRIRNDWAVMLDDVLAGIYANLVLQLIILIKNL